MDRRRYFEGLLIIRLRAGYHGTHFVDSGNVYIIKVDSKLVFIYTLPLLDAFDHPRNANNNGFWVS
jgi:hypothetical protein